MAAQTEIEKTVIVTLQDLGIPYELIEIEPVFADTAEFCREYGFNMEICGNTIVVASKRGPKQYSACVVLGSDRLDVNKKVRGLMNVSRLSFATAEETEELTGMTVGGVTPFALPPGIPVYPDEKLLSVEYLILGSGSRSSKIKIQPGDLKKLPAVQFVPGLSLSHQPPATD